jgi:ABC-type phosphate transport system substrate-binding protein
MVRNPRGKDVFRLLHIVVIPLLLGALMTLPAAVTQAQSPSFVIITNPARPISSLDRKLLADVFLKKITRWSDDSSISPVDLGPKSDTRARFSEEILERSVAAVRNYWRQSVFSGRDVPPPEFDSESDIVAYVSRNPGAIGYVSAATNVNGTRVVQIR